MALHKIIESKGLIKREVHKKIQEKYSYCKSLRTFYKYLNHPEYAPEDFIYALSVVIGEDVKEKLKK